MREELSQRTVAMFAGALMLFIPSEDEAHHRNSKSLHSDANEDHTPLSAFTYSETPVPKTLHARRWASARASTAPTWEYNTRPRTGAKPPLDGVKLKSLKKFFESVLEYGSQVKELEPLVDCCDRKLRRVSLLLTL